MVYNLAFTEEPGDGDANLWPKIYIDKFDKQLFLLINKFAKNCFVLACISIVALVSPSGGEPPPVANLAGYEIAPLPWLYSVT